MPPPKKPALAPASSVPNAEPPSESNGVRDQPGRLRAPLDAVVVTRDRLQEVLDDAVRRGRMTRQDATDLLAEIFARGPRTPEDLVSDVDQLRGGPAARVRREVDRAHRAPALGPAFPILGYDDLSAAQVQSRLGALTPADLRKVRDYE